MVIVILVLLSLVVIYLFSEMQIEKRRNRILQAFLAGVIKSISDYVSKTDILEFMDAGDVIEPYRETPAIPQETLFHNIAHEFQKDFWTRPYWKWIRKDRDLFYEGRYGNDGFNMIYWDFFDKAVADMIKEHQRESQENPEKSGAMNQRDGMDSE